MRYTLGISLPQKCLKKCTHLNVGNCEIHICLIVMRNVNIGEALEIFAKILSDHSNCFFNDLQLHTTCTCLVLNSHVNLLSIEKII